MDTKRQKALRRFRNLRALGGSPNKNEAARAMEQAGALASRHGFTDADVAEPLPVIRRVGGAVDARGDWREIVAYGVAARCGCRALRGGGQVIFEGVRAVDAVAEYRQIVREVDEAQRRCWQAYDHAYRMRMQERHREEFTRAAAEITVQFAGTLGEDSHSLQRSFADEGRLEGRAIMRDRAAKRST